MDDLGSYCLAAFLMIVISSVVSYAMLPHILPTDKKKVSFVDFFLGTSIFKQYRGPKDTPFSASDFPTSPGTDSYNMEIFAERLTAKWTPKSEGTYRDAIIRHAMPYYAFNHAITFMITFLRLKGKVYMTTSLLHWVYLEPGEMLDAGVMQMWLFGYLFNVGTMAASYWRDEILAVAGTDVVAAGTQLLVLRKMQKLSVEGMLKTSNEEAGCQFVGYSSEDSVC